MIYSELDIVSRTKISGDDQPKNLAALSQQGYDIYFVESTVEGKSGSGPEPYFYYEAQRDEEQLRAVTPLALLQLVQEYSANTRN